MIEEAQTQEPTSQAAAQADERAQTSDAAQGEVVQAQPQPVPQPAPPQGAAGGTGVGMEAEHAMATVKAKASALHTLLSNVGHFATLPVVEVEALIAEINYLLGIVRAKL